jgi:predicted ATPase/predicted Ser/Thr protein kinase
VTSPERWPRIKELLDAALDRPPGERSAFVEASCAGDDALRRELEELLASYERGRDFFDMPAAEAAARLIAHDHGGLGTGDSLGHYTILGRLGAGGMGEIYLAEDSRLARKVALKRLPSHVTADRERLRRFQHEARIASVLNHPNVTHIYEIGEAGGVHFIAMEYVEGHSLQTEVGTGPLDPNEVVRIATQIADALEQAHARGITHRDIKPANIMMTARRQVKVLDFGLAKITGLPAGTVPGPEIGTLTETHPMVLMGTVAYMSPEQARREATSGASDVFSLGIILYQLATGQHPFNAESQLGVMHAILSQPVIRPSRLNPAIPVTLEALILHTLEKDARLRPSAAEVRAVLTGMVENASGIGPHTAIRPAKRRTVGREHERAELRSGYQSVVAGRGLFLSVAGEPGIGKTTLVDDFLSELEASRVACSIARGRCSERLAGTEAYLPILEALESLLRDGASEPVARLMKLVAPTWYVQIAPFAAHDASLIRLTDEARAASQERMKRELGAFLQELSRTRPLVLFFDDLHWADLSTVDMLAYLGNKLDTLRVLIVVAYRTSELLLHKHPFAQLKLELQARGVCRDIALDFLSRADIDAYLALEFPEHRLPSELPALIHAKTEGSPLFMVDLVRYLRDRQVIAQEAGHWALARSLPAIEHELPESVRSMIERKIEQLGDADRRLLIVASVQGYEFDSAVVTKALAVDAAEVEERLETLERVHGFVRFIDEHELPDGALTLRYRFVHVLYQNALYGLLRPTRRAALSAAVAEVLLAAYGEQSSKVASELAHLYEAARDFARAADYFRLAAQHASQVFASREAVALARRGLSLLLTIPETPSRREQELSLQVVLGNTLMAAQGYAARETEETYARAHELCEQVGETPYLPPVLWGWHAVHLVRANFRKARELAEEFLSLAERQGDPTVVVGHRAVGLPSLCLGDLRTAHDQFEKAVSIYDPARHRSLAYLYGHEQGVAALLNSALALWLLGYPDRALRRTEEGLAVVGTVQHVNSRAYALYFSAMHYQFRRDAQRALVQAEAAITFSAEQGLALWSAWSAPIAGWALAAHGDPQEGIARIRRGLDATEAIRAEMFRSYDLCLLAEAYGKAGQPREGLAALEQAQRLVAKNDERLWEAEVFRVRGELLLQAADTNRHPPDDGLARDQRQQTSSPAECFQRAIEIAREQRARSLELRAALSLSRIRQPQRQRREAQQILADVYRAFTEGFDTADLKDAAAQLDDAAGRRERSASGGPVTGEALD